VVITGASEGIGAQLAAQLRVRRAKLVLTARNESRMRAAASGDDLIVAGDLTDEAVRRAVVDGAIERFGGIDVLINNAGRGSYYPASEISLDEARSLFELNFFAPLHLAQLATPHIRRNRGTIVNVSSIAGLISLPWLPLYSASKFALASLTSTQRMELTREGVHVMAVFPGYVDTEFQANAAGPKAPEAVVRGRKYAVSAAECARAIIRGLERRKRVVVTPAIGWTLIWLNRWLPGRIERRMESV